MKKAILSLSIGFPSLAIVVTVVARVAAGFQQRVNALENGPCNSVVMVRFVSFHFVPFHSVPPKDLRIDIPSGINGGGGLSCLSTP